MPGETGDALGIFAMRLRDFSESGFQPPERLALLNEPDGHRVAIA